MQDSISLIANSGIQFYRFEAKIDSLIAKKEKIRYVEQWDSSRLRFWMDEVVLLPGDDEVYAKRRELETYGFLSRFGKFSDEIDFDKLEPIEEKDIYETDNINKTIAAFEKNWIPLPYFQKNNINEDIFGPTDWVRIYFERKTDDILSCCLIVDTTTGKSAEDQASPFLHENPNENTYDIAFNDNLALSYLDSLFDCQWVEDCISKIYFGQNTEIEKPFLRHMANYMFLLRVLKGIGKVPRINILSDRNGLIDVDLVIDIGNSKTCALLFENPNESTFNLNAVKRLVVQDLENPLLFYDASFSTRLVFKEADFGALNSELNQNGKFLWPSLVRIGFEAERTINDAKVELRLTRETRTHSSSPKRYLWDNEPSITEWEYHQNDINTPSKRVYKKGISEQINSDGSLCTDSIFGSSSQFSRKSLMTFVYLEVFSHALRQMNSIEFRSLHGSPSQKRKLRRIVISCPTAMIRKEQVALRECAQDAMRIINNFTQIVNGGENSRNIYEDTVEIIPSVKDLNLDLENLEKRKDWIYDEATSAQMVFMYGMIKHKFGGNANLFFNLFGKAAKTGLNNRRLTVGSLDIGGGTSDLMICRYEYQQDVITELTPEPLFWESFNLAGDDLMKDLIQQIIIEGKIEKDGDVGCTGVIENYARDNGITSVGEKLNGFFGKDSNNIGYKGKLMRTNFINQIAIPVILKFMENANSDNVVKMQFADLFPNEKPNEDLLKHFENHFGFRFEQIEWTLSSEKVNEIVESVFSKLVKLVSSIMNEYACDLIVLSGRPSSFKALEKLFFKYCSITPNRIFNLNNYWIGRWYPFANNNGYIDDPKTVVTVGSLISLMGGNLLKLGDLRINSAHLKNKLISTAEYVGSYKNNSIVEIVLSPNIHEAEVTVHHLPFLIGFKNINSKQYPARVLYSLHTNENKIAEVSSKRGGLEREQLADAIQDFKLRIRTKMPLKVRMSRDAEKDKEVLKIEEVVDCEGNDISKAYFQLITQTLSDEVGYWLDTGEFTLNTRI